MSKGLEKNSKKKKKTTYVVPTLPVGVLEDTSSTMGVLEDTLRQKNLHQQGEKGYPLPL